MTRYTIWRNGMIMGTYPGPKEADAFDALSRDEGFADFDACNQQLGLTRDDYKVKKIEE